MEPLTKFFPPPLERSVPRYPLSTLEVAINQTLKLLHSCFIHRVRICVAEIVEFDVAQLQAIHVVHEFLAGQGAAV